MALITVWPVAIDKAIAVDLPVDHRPVAPQAPGDIADTKPHRHQAAQAASLLKFKARVVRSIAIPDISAIALSLGLRPSHRRWDGLRNRWRWGGLGWFSGFGIKGVGAMAGQPGFFDLDERYAALSKSGDPLERLSDVVDFEIFRDELERVLKRSDQRKGGRPPMDAVMMFKILVIQALWGLSDEQVEYQVRDRLSFMRFLGLELSGRVPDYSTVWRFREVLAEAGAIEGLFARFDAELKAHGYFALGGQIVDASIVEAPKQRLTREEKEQVKRGERPNWKPAKAAHKDVEARWTIKRGRVKKKPGPALKPSERLTSGLLIPAFGYKSHINVDRRHRLIRRWQVSHAAAYDGGQLPRLLDPDAFDSRVWGDTAYRSAANERAIAKAGRRSMIHFRKPKGRRMPGPHQRANRARSKVRSAVEHVLGTPRFAHAEQKARMGLFIRSVGLARAKVKIGMANLAYNMRRLVWLDKSTTPT